MKKVVLLGAVACLLASAVSAQAAFWRQRMQLGPEAPDHRTRAADAATEGRYPEDAPTADPRADAQNCRRPEENDRIEVTIGKDQNVPTILRYRQALDITEVVARSARGSYETTIDRVRERLTELPWFWGLTEEGPEEVTKAVLRAIKKTGTGTASE